ncbi:LysR family transcriptional regulator [Marinomonas sp. S3726]|uniref:LysR family transcriptional regulator n=1 Tax=Marinomonas sp. S3726 TaxID=579484 RepID=UPI0005FA2DB6|nr:LysR substrate-binding domain-containing protein [Marinomonas sp. S3726]KJZ11502.1 LysR family transcriptional regulator [Marinomonas sp. S3726]
MKEINWRGVDLNLLLTFNALMQFESVSGASKHLNLGQPATSYNLKRLRQLLNDPLFERQGHKMVPSFRAKEIAPHITHILSIMTNEVLPQGEFDFASYDGIYKIGLTDYAEQIFGPALFDTLLENSPNSKVLFKPADSQNSLNMLENGEIDLCIGVFNQLPDNVSKTFLYREKHWCIFDNKQVKTEIPIPLDAYLETPQIIVTANEELTSKVDITLKNMGVKRNVVLGTTRFFTVRRMLSGRKQLAVVAEMVGRSDLIQDKLSLSPPPIDIPDFDVDMICLSRNASHPRLVWLDEKVKALVQAKVEALKPQR